MNESERLAELKKNYAKHVARIKWLNERNVQIKAVYCPYGTGCYAYYELLTPIPGKDFAKERWSIRSDQAESLDSLVDRMMNQERGADLRGAMEYVI
jgi:hypothetical protein